jgi:hypothetical protein
LFIWIVAVLLGTLLVQFLWNEIVATNFHAPILSYWAVFGLLILISIIGGYFRK